MKKLIIIIVAVVLAVALAAGGFFGGMAYQRNQANAVRNNFLNSRGLNNADPGAGPAGPNAPAGGFPGGGLTGQIKSIDGNTITLSTAQAETKVTFSDATVIEKTENGAASDLQAGQQVTVTGRGDADGNFTASQVLILGNNQMNR